MRTIVDAITSAAGGAGVLTTLDEPPVAWREVHGRAARLAGHLAAQGIGPGRRVGFLAETSVDLVVAVQAVWLAGGAITMLPPVRRGDLDPVRRIAADAGFAALVTDRPYDGLPATHLSTWDDLARSGVGIGLPEVRPSDVAIVQYTSGSTSEPTPVAVTHAHLAANISGLRTALSHDAWHGQPLASWLPLHHDMGLVGFLAFPMACGCPLVLQTPASFARNPAGWFAALDRHRAAVTGAPCFAYRMMIALLESGPQLDLSAVRHMICGGEPIDAVAMAAFLRAAQAHGLVASAFTPAYGLAEATLAVTMAYGLSADAQHLTRLGRPIAGTAVRICDPATGTPLPDREVGRIEVSGPSVTVDGWLDTGDLGYLAGGDLVVCGRIKDVLIAGGRNVFPQDVEIAAGRVRGVRPGGVVAFGVPGAAGDRLVVAVEARTDLRPAVAEAVAGAVGMTPADVVLLRPGGCPRTSSGKPRRIEARRRYLAGELRRESYRDR
jgi:fatty-acyl-CoA synthase